MELSDFPLSSWGPKSETGSHTRKSLEQKPVLIAVSLQVDKKKNVYQHMSGEENMYTNIRVLFFQIPQLTQMKNHTL